MSDYIMFGKYQIFEDSRGLSYSVHYKDFGEQYVAATLQDALIWCLQDWEPLTIHDYRSA